MSSDYIPRLRRELLRAGATKPSRSAHAARALRPLVAAAAVALVVLAVVLAFPRGDEPPSRPSEPAAGTLQLSYRGEPSSAEASARVMTERLTAAGVRDAGVSVAAGGALAITVPSSARADVAALADRGRLAVYDWERSVLGPRSTPAPRDERVTGGPDAGRDAATTKSVAEARAADAPGGRAVRALSVAPDGWFALGGPPALTNADIQGARADVDPATQEPIVALHLTADGRKAFSALTRDLARRGSANAGAGSGNEAAQHFAIVVDDRIVSVPYIDFRQAPNGIDGSAGLHIQGGLTPATARQLAALLSAGPLAAALEREG
jgi:preprotein translocase subunit SecD